MSCCCVCLLVVWVRLRRARCLLAVTGYAHNERREACGLHCTRATYLRWECGVGLCVLLPPCVLCAALCAMLLWGGR